MKSHLPYRLTESFKFALATGSLLVGAGSVVQGQTIIHYAGSPLKLTNTSDSIVFSFTSGQAMIEPIGTNPSSVDTPQFRLGYLPGDHANKPTLGGYSPAPDEFYGSVLNVDNFTTKLDAGDSIDEISGVYKGDTTTYLWQPLGQGEGPWIPGTTGYAGVQFDDPVATDQINYGWVLITYDTDQSLTLIDFAYDTTGGAIAAGAIPEPSSWALILAGGTLAAAACRGRRKAKALAAAGMG